MAFVRLRPLLFLVVLTCLSVNVTVSADANESLTEAPVTGVTTLNNSISLNLKNAFGQPLTPPVYYGDLITAQMTLIDDNYGAILAIQCEFSSGPASLPTSKLFFVVSGCPNHDIIDLFDYIISVKRNATSMTLVFRAFVFGNSDGGQLYMTCDFRGCPQAQLCAPTSNCWGESSFDASVRSEDDSLGTRPNSRFSFNLTVPEILATTNDAISIHNGTLCMTDAIAYLTFSALGVITVLFLCSICVVAFLAIGYCGDSCTCWEGRRSRRGRRYSGSSIVERIYVQPQTPALQPVYVHRSSSLGHIHHHGLRKTYRHDIVDPAIYSIDVPQVWADRANALAERQTHQASRRLSLDGRRHLSRPEIENWSLGDKHYRRRVV